MQTIRQFDHNDTDIFRHRKKHLTQILRLHLQPVCILVLRIFNIIRQMQMLQLGYTIHEKKDFIPEFLPHLFSSSSARMIATQSGWIIYASPDLRTCPLCASKAT